ncbi:MAG: TonB-dependent receptor, partial [Gammaproteobacteria bacterium]
FEIANNWTVNGIASIVRGERDDIEDNLYRVNPNTLRIAANYDGGAFTVKIEQVMVADQNRISQTNSNDPSNGNNNSDPTHGYSLTNAYLNWFVDENLTLTLGVDNLFDDDYIDHLTGFNRVLDSVVPRGSRMLGPGQNFFGRLQWQW